MMSNEARLMNILCAPIISEKGNLVAEKQNAVAFKVLPDARKDEIKKAVETIFNVKVASVHTINVAGKSRRSAHGMGRRSDWKKAYVTLADGEQINFSSIAQKENS